jgi:hypothetical protein
MNCFLSKYIYRKNVMLLNALEFSWGQPPRRDIICAN